jgi:prepilin-type N-terminal cleavage/methylation domain-containing protein
MKTPISRARSGAEHGFTLIELLVVLTLVALMSAAVLPRFMGAGQESARHWAARAAIELRAARQQAIVGARPVSVPIDPDVARLRSPNGADADEVLFFPDGSSTGGRLEFELHGRIAIVVVDDLTGAVSLRNG